MDSNSNSFTGCGGFGFIDVTNDVVRSFPPIIRMQCPTWQFLGAAVGW